MGGQCFACISTVLSTAKIANLAWSFAVTVPVINSLSHFGKTTDGVLILHAEQAYFCGLETSFPLTKMFGILALKHILYLNSPFS